MLRAAPRIPQDDGEILERLPTALFAAMPELRAQRAALARDPQDLALAAQLARRYLEIGRSSFDPRYFGYAEAVLGPWWTLATPPPEVLLLRGLLRQQRHDFDGALADLAAVLRQDPRNAQAWLTRAGLLQIRGEQQQAMRHCSAVLAQAQHRFAATACLCKSLSLGGEAREAYALLGQLLESSTEAPAAERRWAWTLLAEMAERLGRPDEAERHFRQALATGSPDRYLLMSYADFLLDREQPARARELLAGETQTDALLLRLALAERRLGLDPAAHIAKLRASFDASLARGDRAHPGEAARLQLYLLDRPAEALRLAQANWATQREPRDARILLEAALAAGAPAAAQPALSLMQDSALEDVQLSRLAAQLRAVSE